MCDVLLLAFGTNIIPPRSWKKIKFKAWNLSEIPENSGFFVKFPNFTKSCHLTPLKTKLTAHLGNARWLNPCVQAITRSVQEREEILGHISTTKLSSIFMECQGKKSHILVISFTTRTTYLPKKGISPLTKGGKCKWKFQLESYGSETFETFAESFTWKFQLKLSPQCYLRVARSPSLVA